MKMKNKFLTMALAVIMLASVAGCSDTVETTGSTEVSTSTQTQTTESTASTELDSVTEAALDEYYFVSGDVTVQVDADMDELIALLGESKSVFEAPSCAGEGISYFYSYASFEIETYPASDGKNRIGYIYLKDDMVATTEGIDLSMEKADVIDTYGEDYEAFDSAIIYEKEGSKLCFIFDGDQIISIEYRSAVIA